ncbi:MAG TPA: four helix bundle protein [Gemmatimonadaceae bacterium]|nr:four helix bundle protein [Gemmatimonadaceae bacterium]
MQHFGMQDARNLKVTEKAEELAVMTYQVTAGFPRAEQFGLTSQMRRAAVSVGSNIAEGCGRSGDRDLVPFLHYALGSAAELEFQLRVASRLGFAAPDRLEPVAEAAVEVKRMLSRLVVALRPRRP